MTVFKVSHHDTAPLPEVREPSTLDTLDGDPFDDDLGAELAKRAPRGVPTRATLALGGAVLVVAGFLGGVVVQKNYGATSAASSPAGGLGNFAGGFAGRGNPSASAAAGTGGGGGGGGGGQRGGNATTGTVKFVDGTTLYLTTADGETITVKTSGTTTVRTQQTTALTDLPVGATVTIQGTTDADGVVTATQVTATR
jgi:hypothetical protein